MIQKLHFKTEFSYLEAARRMEIHPSEILVFEDSVTGVTAAKRAGATVVAIPVYWETAGRLMEAGASRIFLDWREINVVELIEKMENQ